MSWLRGSYAFMHRKIKLTHPTCKRYFRSALRFLEVQFIPASLKTGRLGGSGPVTHCSYLIRACTGQKKLLHCTSSTLAMVPGNLLSLGCFIVRNTDVEDSFILSSTSRHNKVCVAQKSSSEEDRYSHERRAPETRKS